MDKFRIAVIVGSKGRGSNMEALVRAGGLAEFPAQVALVISPVEGSPATDRAKSLGVDVLKCSPKQPDYSKSLLQYLIKYEIDLVCLAGLMTKLPSEIVERFRGRVLNIHPALLPKFGGKGMYGLHVHRAVLDAGESESGCTVHIVSDEYDEGPIVFQMRCPVLVGDTEESLAARVLHLEHEAYPKAVRILLEHHG